MSLKKLALEHLGRTIQEGQHNPVRASTVGEGEGEGVVSPCPVIPIALRWVE